MQVETLKVGILQENTYILSIDDKVIVIDPGDEFDKINKVINNRKVLAILITHKHSDHIGALKYFKNINIYSYDNLKEQEYNIDRFKFNVIFNPGHSSDSVSYYFKEYNYLFCGDFIFYHNIGRCDLPTGNFNEMLESISKIKALPDNTIIYPGHDKITTIKEEKQHNYYF